jgi:hypothetical protein
MGIPGQLNFFFQRLRDKNDCTAAIKDRRVVAELIGYVLSAMDRAIAENPDIGEALSFHIHEHHHLEVASISTIVEYTLEILEDLCKIASELAVVAEGAPYLFKGEESAKRKAEALAKHHEKDYVNAVRGRPCDCIIKLLCWEIERGNKKYGTLRVAPFEADAQVAFEHASGRYDVLIATSCDADFMCYPGVKEIVTGGVVDSKGRVFGCHIIVDTHVRSRRVISNGKGDKTWEADFTAAHPLLLLLFPSVVGCDYSNVAGVGVVKLMKLLAEHLPQGLPNFTVEHMLTTNCFGLQPAQFDEAMCGFAGFLTHSVRMEDGTFEPYVRALHKARPEAVAADVLDFVNSHLLSPTYMATNERLRTSRSRAWRPRRGQATGIVPATTGLLSM